jgi:ubiquinone biosynthesis protein Coq4
VIEPGVNVREARDRYLAAAGFTTESYVDPNFVIKVGFLTMRFPNPGLLPMHDLHHVATGYDSSLIGESEISVFELRAGWGKPLIFFLCCGSLLIGLCVAPKRMWQAWKRARGARSLYETTMPYETLLAMNVGELRELIGLEG